MELVHAGLGASSMENAERFYGRLLGLTRTTPKTLPAALSEAIFGIPRDLTMMRWTGDAADFEIFIDPDYAAPQNQVLHTCIAVPDRDHFVRRCRDAGLKVNEVPKGDSRLVFVCDFDGNLFEVKAAG